MKNMLRATYHITVLLCCAFNMISAGINSLMDAPLDPRSVWGGVAIAWMAAGLAFMGYFVEEFVHVDTSTRKA